MNLVITGGSKGIGYAIAEAFARSANDSLQIAICSRNLKERQQAADRLREILGARGTVIAEQCDVSRENEVGYFSNYVLQQFGHVDVLVNNAGFGRFAPVHEMQVSTWMNVLETNLRGVFLTTKAFLPSMIAQQAGTVVTISSLAGKNGFANGSAYCASKFAIRGLMQSMFLEVREHNIRAITVFPGSVQTEFFASAGFAPSPNALYAQDVATAVHTACMLPINADISELDIRPTNPKR